MEEHAGGALHGVLASAPALVRVPVAQIRPGVADMLAVGVAAHASATVLPQGETQISPVRCQNIAIRQNFVILNSSKMQFSVTRKSSRVTRAYFKNRQFGEMRRQVSWQD